MEFKISNFSSEKRVLFSSSVILYEKNSDFYLRLTNDKDDNDYLGIRFVFSETEDLERKILMKSIRNSSDAIINCINYRDDVATKTPIHIGYFENDDEIVNIYIHFWIVKLNDESTKKIDYTIYAEDNLKNG